MHRLPAVHRSRLTPSIRRIVHLIWFMVPSPAASLFTERRACSLERHSRLSRRSSAACWLIVMATDYGLWMVDVFDFFDTTITLSAVNWVSVAGRIVHEPSTRKRWTDQVRAHCTCDHLQISFRLKSKQFAKMFKQFDNPHFTFWHFIFYLTI